MDVLEKLLAYLKTIISLNKAEAPSELVRKSHSCIQFYLFPAKIIIFIKVHAFRNDGSSNEDLTSWA